MATTASRRAVPAWWLVVLMAAPGRPARRRARGMGAVPRSPHERTEFLLATLVGSGRAAAGHSTTRRVPGRFMRRSRRTRKSGVAATDAMPTIAAITIVAGDR